LREVISANLQTRFSSGYAAGDLARDLPGGILIRFEGIPLSDQVAQTEEAIKLGTDVVYEAAFSYDSISARRTNIRKVSAVQPILPAIDSIADHCELCSFCCSINPTSKS